jgi:hypothetical protein
MKRISMVIASLLIVPMIANADLTIKEKTYTKAFMGMWTSEGTEITYLKGDKMRTESDVERKGMPVAQGMEEAAPGVTIIRLDKGIVWHVNMDDETYMETALGGEVTEEGEKPTDFQFKVKGMKIDKTGETKEIIGHKCEGVAAEVTFETTAGEETITQPVNLLFWMTKKTKGLEEMRKFWEQMIEMSQGQEQGLPMGDAMKELWEKMEELKGVPLGMEMTISRGGIEEGEMEGMKEAMAAMKQFMKGEETEEAAEEEEGADEMAMKMVREITSMSESDLDDSLFEIPEGFKKASMIRRW